MLRPQLFTFECLNHYRGNTILVDSSYDPSAITAAKNRSNIEYDPTGRPLMLIGPNRKSCSGEFVFVD